MKDELRRRWPVLLVILILLIGIGIGLVWNSHRQRAESERLQTLSDNYNEVIRPLWEQKRQIEDKLYALEQQSAVADLDLGTAIIVVTEEMADAREEIIPAVTKAGYRGYITYDRNFLRGKEGDFMTVEELRALKEEGWSFCLEVTELTYIEECCDLVQALDLPPAEAAFFPHDGCNEEQRNILAKHGIHTLIQYRDGELEGVDTENGETEPLTKRDGSQGPWIIRALGSNDANSNRGLYNAVTSSSCVAMTIGYTDSLAEYDKGNLRSLLSVLNEYEAQERLMIGNLDLAWERLQERKAAAAEQQQEIDQERDRLQKKLDQAVKEIQNAEQAHGNGGAAS